MKKKIMNNEKMNQIIDEAYNSYLKHTIIAVNTGLDRVKRYLNNCLVEYDGYYEHFTNPSFQYGYRPHTKEEFINKCKTDSEFSEKWGLKIEERELSLEEKEYQLEKTNCINDIENDRIIYGHEWEKYIQEQYEGIQLNQGIKIPTKLITITYNNETIEVYE